MQLLVLLPVVMLNIHSSSIVLTYIASDTLVGNLNTEAIIKICMNLFVRQSDAQHVIVKNSNGINFKAKDNISTTFTFRN